MENRPGKKIFLFMGAIVGWLAAGLQLGLILVNRETSLPEAVIRFFSYFTILTNILVAGCFTVLAGNQQTRFYRFLSRTEVLTAVAVYITVVGLVYQIVLRPLWEPEGLQFIVDELLHTVIPIAYVAYWLLAVPKTGLKYKQIFWWLIYPGCYLIYILLRGAWSGVYPYPFVDVPKLGYAVVFMNSGVLLGLFVILSGILISIAKTVDKNKPAL